MTTNEQTPAMPSSHAAWQLQQSFFRNSGKWLQESGFKSGQVIDITCEDRKCDYTIFIRRASEAQS